MKYPKLVRKARCKLRVELESQNKNEDGDFDIVFVKSCLCNIQETNKRVVDGKKVANILERKYLIDGDFFGELNFFSGYVIREATGERAKIKHIAKAHNPDGSVNFTEILVD